MEPLFTPAFTTDDLFATLRDNAPWVNVQNAPRNECFMALDTSLTYSYGRAARDRTYTAAPMHPGVVALMARINAHCGTAYNVAVLNYYLDQRNHLGWHSDDSPEQDPTHPIAVVSFGAERELWVKAKDHKGPIPLEDRYLLTVGSLFVMPPGFQDDYFHKIPKCDHVCGGRISLTYRKLDR